jgi:cyclic pyranopterin phosphate synthase
MIIDETGRSFKKLRISLTNECNYACIYCVDSKSAASPVLSETMIKPLPTSELITIIRKLHNELNLEAVRLTGGEPLLHPRVMTLISSIKEMGINSIGITTNGHFLSNKVEKLINCGLSSVNISIDALDPTIFKSINLNNGLNNVLKSIEAALLQGLSVKLNTVVMKGKNHTEIVPLLEFAMKKGIVIRFLELMSMGPLHESKKMLFFSKAQILETISSHYPIIPLIKEYSSTAEYWSINEKKAFGIIANDSSPFCNDCNRLRLDSYGNIYGCLSSLIPVPVSANSNRYALRSALKEAISHKQPVHFIGNFKTMQSIGG